MRAAGATQMDVTRITGIGRDLRARVKTFFDTPLGVGASPLEVAQAVLDEAEAHVEPTGGGRRVFPYTALHVRVLVADGGADAMEAGLAGLASRLRERLVELRCDAPRALDVHLTCVTEPPAAWPAGRVVHVEYVRRKVDGERVAAPASAAHVRPLALTVTVVCGAASEQAYRFTDGTVSIGRSADPTDGIGRLRRNRVVFADVVDGVTETVGRAHARLRFDPEGGGFRLYDEGSSNGTAVLRGGDVIAVGPRDPRGVRVRSGDEVCVGRAVLRLEIG